jgi:L-asparaginase/Glu-tRNA(Gln) amidotransferase subunit D
VLLSGFPPRAAADARFHLSHLPMYTSHVNPIRLGLRLVLLAVLSTIAVPAGAQPAPPPRVRLIATGGTISNRTGGRLTAEDLIRSIPDLPRYARPEFEQYVVMVYQGASGDLITSAVDHGARGIVVAAAGAGATSGMQGQALNEALGKGVFVVTSTRTGSGRIAARRAPVLAAAPPAATGEAPGQMRARPATYIAAEDLAPVKARILLMLALAQTRDPAEIQRMFTQYQ